MDLELNYFPILVFQESVPFDSFVNIDDILLDLGKRIT